MVAIEPLETSTTQVRRFTQPRLGVVRPMRCPPIGEVEGPLSARFHHRRPGIRLVDSPPIGGLRMSQRFAHEPAMVGDVVDLFASVPPGLVVDATIGGGGHARALLEAHPHLQILGIDRDTEALAAARWALRDFGDRYELVHARFDSLPTVLAERGIDQVSGVLFDLGVSSYQLDRPDRGFSYRADAPLDMRMDRTQTTTAEDIVNSWTENDLVDLLREHGEGRLARRLARAIIESRPIHSTGELVEIVAAATPAPGRRAGHPAKRVFQALRVEVNDELRVLPVALDAALGALAPGGRVVVLSYHSGEDRLVKERFLDEFTGGCTCPQQLPCVCGALSTVKLLTRGACLPSRGEVRSNPRAEAARLRAVERLDPSDYHAREGR